MFFFFSSRRRHTRYWRDWSSDVCSSDLLGLGERAAVLVPCDDQDRVLPEALERTLRSVSGPTVIAVECGNVNTGAFDDFDAVADVADRHRAAGNPTWVHVDGAVMLLAAAAPGMSRHVRGLDRMDSWSTDAHKLLNVAYDCGVAICRNPAAHRAAMSVQASYLEQGTGARDPMDWNPEFSRRARGVGVYARSEERRVGKECRSRGSPYH